jgi:hypothetical protein
MFYFKHLYIDTYNDIYNMAPAATSTLFDRMPQQGILTQRGRLRTIDLLIKVGLLGLSVICFATKVNNLLNLEVADLKWLVQGGQLYFELSPSFSLPWPHI